MTDSPAESLPSVPERTERPKLTAVRNTIALEEALGFLPPAGDVHTFIDGGVMLVGADWTRGRITEALRGAPSIFITGPAAQKTGHGLAIQHPHPLAETMLFIETTRRTDS